MQPVQMNIYQINALRKDLKWFDFDDEPRVQGKQKMKDHRQSYIFVSVAYITTPSSK